ncbi:hypothetical protein [Paenibacillus sp. R14(2021)]|uniref:hypothetical protein n=1 Tax=Paenibacillus sp. R14(2021) TaxID=2859228 RepID=UPI001C612BA0|nr:hypothetical protein [Paenibacillus sp. R14(2021)]
MILEIMTYIIILMGCSIYQVRQFVSKKQSGLTVFYSCLMGICVITGSLWIAHVQLPSLTTPLRTMFEPVGKFILAQHRSGH